MSYPQRNNSLLASSIRASLLFLHIFKQSSMAAADVMMPLKAMEPAFEPLIQAPSAQVLSTDDFDPKKHIDYLPPSKVFTMHDLNLPEDTGISPLAVSEPFPLFTQEAVHRMRAEVLSKDVWDNCQYSSNLAHCQLRGFAPKWAPLHPRSIEVR